MTVDLEPLWKLAQQRLAAANAVCFIGYRFPPTDSTARKRLLKALPSDFGTRVHIVLGPDVHHPDVKRLEGLVTSRVSPHQMQSHPTFGQDFRSVFELKTLPP